MSVETNPWFQEKEYKSVWLVIQDSRIWFDAVDASYVWTPKSSLEIYKYQRLRLRDLHRWDEKIAEAKREQ